MSCSYGWAGFTAIIDLTSSRITVQKSDPEMYAMAIGGRGFTANALAELKKGTNPLDEANIIAFAAGPLTGTNLPASSRISVGCLNAINGAYTWANAGGAFGAALKYAGFDSITVTGCSPKPVYLLIEAGRIKIETAEQLWGLDISATEKMFYHKSKDARISTAAIGPAGENMSRQACIMVDQGRAAGWGGCGAVMGSKKLKAITVRYNQGQVVVANPEKFAGLTQQLWERAKKSKMIRLYCRYGTMGMHGSGGIESTLPQAWRNHQDDFWDAEKYIKLKEVVFRERYEQRRLSCFGCPVACSHLYCVGKSLVEKDQIYVEGIQANTIRGFGSLLDIDEPEIVLQANALCNSLGLDVDGVSSALAWAFECFEKGVLNKAETGGLELNWGNGRAALTLIRKIAFREGLGDLLAEGVAGAAQKLGRGSEAWAITIKDVGMNEQCVRSHKAWALGIMTSARGGGHLSGSPATEQKGIPASLAQEMFGIPTAGDHASYEGKGKLVVWYERFKALVDMMGFCYFVTWWGGDKQLIGPQDLVCLYEAATGLKVSLDDLYYYAERQLNLEKALNTLHRGFSRDDDQPHQRFVERKIGKGGYNGEYLDLENWQKMLSEYYSAHGWDSNMGWQGKSILEQHGLSMLAERLQNLNRLGD